MYDSGGSNISVTLKLSTYKMGTRSTFRVDLKQGVWCHGGSQMKGYVHPSDERRKATASVNVKFTL